jgi:endonuclease G, mitochondrial
MYGTQIPIEFWKVIAFIHDETGALTATGYTMSQKSFLPQVRFVFGQYETWQQPIKVIEDRAGLSFGNLRAHDPLRKARPRVAAPVPLSDFGGITV